MRTHTSQHANKHTPAATLLSPADPFRPQLVDAGANVTKQSSLLRGLCLLLILVAHGNKLINDSAVIAPAALN